MYRYFYGEGMVKPRPLAALIIVLSLLPSVAHAMSWIRIADVSKVHEVYNTTVPFRARWWDINVQLPLDIDLPPINALYVKITAKLQCSNGIPPKYNITFYVSFAGHNMTKKLIGYGTSGATYTYVLLLNKTVDSKLHIDLATDAKGCKAYPAFIMTVYPARLKETLDWNPGANATIVFEYQLPNPKPTAFDIAYTFKLDPSSTKTEITVAPRQLILIPVPEDLLGELVGTITQLHEELASYIINKTAELANRTIAEEARHIPAAALVARSLAPASAQQQNTAIPLYVPREANYTFVVDARIEKLVEVKGAQYKLLNNTILALKNLQATVKASIIEEVPVGYTVWTKEGMKTIAKGAIYLPAEANVNVYYVEPVLEAELPNATTVEWRGENYTIGFNASKIYTMIRVNNETLKRKLVTAVEEITICFYLDHYTCSKRPIDFAYAPWGYLMIRDYNETTMTLQYFIPELYNVTMGNNTYTGIFTDQRMLVLIYGWMKPGTQLVGLELNGTIRGVVVALSAKPRRAEIISGYRLKLIEPIVPGPYPSPMPAPVTTVEPYETKHGYLLAFNADGYVRFSAAVNVHVRDAETGGPVEAEVLALQNGTVVDRARGSDVTLKLFPGNYTLEARVGSLAFYRNLTVKDDMDVTIKVTLPKVTNVTVKAPRYSFGETELRITVKLDKPAPADYNITGRIVVDDSWERNFTIPVKANTTEASTVVKLSLGEGKHHIKIIVGNAVAEAEVTVASGSIGFAVAVVVGITAVGVVLFLLRRPREIVF